MSDLAGQLLEERWEVLAEIGRGGFSVVYEARDRRLDQTVALKLLVPPPSAAETALERLRREVKAVRALSHPSIVRIYDLVERPDRAFLVMERVPGEDLARAVAAHGTLASALAARLGQHLAEALAQAHRAGIVHRDVKPQNILLSSLDDRVCLADFGAARLDSESTVTKTGAFVGTLDYAAPETLAGARADGRADVYGLGMSLFFALTGKLPARPSPHLPPTPSPLGHSPRALRPEVTPALDGVVRRATASDPRDRQPTAGLLAEDLAAAAAAPATRLGPAPLSFCLACGRLDKGPLCASCRGGAPGGELVCLRPQSRSARSEYAVVLEQAVAAPVPEVYEVAAGRRALIAVSPERGRLVVERLGAAGLSATSLPRGRAYRLLPPSFHALSMLVAASGLALAAATGSVVGLVGPPLALALWWLGLGTVSRPLLVPTPTAPLPAELDARLERAVAVCEIDGVRALLGDLTALARLALGQPGLAPVLCAQLVGLLGSACDAAEALGRMERSTAILRGRTAGAGRDERLREALAAADRAHDALVQQLLDALATTALVAAQGDRDAERLAAELAQRRREVAAEVELRAEALREIDDLLG